MRILALSVLAIVTACGSADPTSPKPGISLVFASTIQDNTKTIVIRALAPRDNDNVIVTCTSLLSGNPFDERYNVLQSGSFSYPPVDGSQTLTLADIKNEDGVLIYVAARDSRNALIGEGCQDGVNIKSGETQDVAIIIYAPK